MKITTRWARPLTQNYDEIRKQKISKRAVKIKILFFFLTYNSIYRQKICNLN